MKIYITPILANGISSASLKRKQPTKWAIEILGGQGRNRTKAEDALSYQLDYKWRIFIKKLNLKILRQY